MVNSTHLIFYSRLIALTLSYMINGVEAPCLIRVLPVHYMHMNMMDFAAYGTRKKEEDLLLFFIDKIFNDDLY